MSTEIYSPKKRLTKIPFDKPAGAGRVRHHIIPQAELIKIAREVLADSKHRLVYMAKVISKVKMSDIHWNLGATTMNRLYDNILRNKLTEDDIYAWYLVVMWLPGNIVIGPHRKNDPGDKFDEEAFDKLKAKGTKYGSRVNAITYLWFHRESNLLGMKVELLSRLGRGDFAEVGWVEKLKKSFAGNW